MLQQDLIQVLLPGNGKNGRMWCLHVDVDANVKFSIGEYSRLRWILRASASSAVYYNSISCLKNNCGWQKQSVSWQFINFFQTVKTQRSCTRDLVFLFCKNKNKRNKIKTKIYDVNFWGCFRKNQSEAFLLLYGHLASHNISNQVLIAFECVGVRILGGFPQSFFVCAGSLLVCLALENKKRWLATCCCGPV